MAQRPMAMTWFAPSGEGAIRCMKMALQGVEGPIDYINPHATSTPVGDQKEIEAIREVFGDAIPPISATKSLTGHSPRSDRCAGSNLLSSDDAERFHL